MKIYLDNCCFNRPYDNQDSLRISLETQAKLHVQHLIKTGRLEMATSYVLFYENKRNPFEMRQSSIMDFFNKYSSVYIGTESAAQVKPIADSIIATGVKTQDAYHVACAQFAGCMYFLTTDDRLLKFKSSTITLLNPVDFIKLLETE